MKTGWIHAEENNTNVRFAPKTMVSEVLISENGPDLMTALNQMLLEKCYPVGAVYLGSLSFHSLHVPGRRNRRNLGADRKQSPGCHG